MNEIELARLADDLEHRAEQGWDLYGDDDLTEREIELLNLELRRRGHLLLVFDAGGARSEAEWIMGCPIARAFGGTRRFSFGREVSVCGGCGRPGCSQRSKEMPPG